MIISALVKRYEDIPDIPIGWQKREVSYALDIDEYGQLLDVILLEKTDNEAEQKKRTLTLPLEFVRQGIRAYEIANFLCDNGNYMLGVDPKKFESARRIHEELLRDAISPQTRAILAYFSSGIPRFPSEKLDKKTAVAAKFVFQFSKINGRFADYSDEVMRNAWNMYYTKESGGLIRCLVTGKEDISLHIHSVLHLRGGQSSGSRLISANAESFTSYSKTAKDRAADVGKYAAFAYVTALNMLLKDEKHRKFIGGDTLVFWAEKGGEAEEALFSDMMAPPKADEGKNLEDCISKLAKGDWIAGYKPDRLFFLLCLSPNAARISVRFFHVGAFGDLLRNIQAHYSRLHVVRDGKTPFRFLPLWLILKETTAKQAGDVSPLLGGQLLRSILTGMDYPFTLFYATLERIRAGEAVSQTKAAIIKATLVKNYNESEVTTVALNEDSTYKPYVLGRLFSVLERLQEIANSNTTIRDRYFSSACTNPINVFPTLLKLSMHHASKLDNSVFYEKLKRELLARLDDESPFPAMLSLDDQGRFILGYYHQRQSFFPNKDKVEA